MWENLKSKYILKIIFSYIYERTKLNIVKYNKTLQNQMNTSLINYKVYLGKYIILAVTLYFIKFTSLDIINIFKVIPFEKK